MLIRVCLVCWLLVFVMNLELWVWKNSERIWLFTQLIFWQRGGSKNNSAPHRRATELLNWLIKKRGKCLHKGELMKRDGILSKWKSIKICLRQDFLRILTTFTAGSSFHKFHAREELVSVIQEFCVLWDMQLLSTSNTDFMWHSLYFSV